MNKFNLIINTISTILQTVLIVLKLTGHINWSWGWVLFPFWMPIIFIIIFGIFLKLFLK
jgi:hypothetical protein